MAGDRLAAIFTVAFYLSIRTLPSPLTESPYCDCNRLSCLAPILNRSTTKAQKRITRGAARIGQIAALSLD
jgi:hypothetical protein